MDYKTVGNDQKQQALVNRLGQLEAMHYSNEVYLLEARALGDSGRVAQLNAEQDALEVMMEPVNRELEKFSSTEDKGDDE